jgi:hypothetical protein
MLVIQVLEGLICSLYRYLRGSYARYTGIRGGSYARYTGIRGPHMLVKQALEGAHMLVIQVLEGLICSLYRY